MNMERHTGWKHWFQDVGYIYVLVAAIACAVFALTEADPVRPAQPSAVPASAAPGYSPP